VKDRSDSLVRPLLVFALLALLALTLVAATGIVVVRGLATEQALTEARQLTEVSARVVEGRVNDALLTGDAESLGTVASAVVNAVLHDPVVRVKIWTRDGEIVYSDVPELIGSRYALGAEDADVLEHGGVEAEVSDLSAPENRYERQFGELLEVYTQSETPDGIPLLFETYQLASSIADRRRELLSTFVPVLIATLVALALLMVPIAWILARRVRAAQFERERLMQQMLDASDRERRRIAGEVHDGPVQELAGLSMRLSASAERIDDPAAREVVSDSAAAVRGSVRTLRSAIVGIYPPNLQQAGLAASLSDLVARLEPFGIEGSLDLDGPGGFGADVDAAIYRACQEALRNVAEHADARHARVSVHRDGHRAVLEVVDDGRGIDEADRERAREEGHLGMRMMADLARDTGGTLSIRPGDTGGTTVRMEVPIG
jgi:two-component system NarL family sensor kinase